MRILLTGGSGRLGTELRAELPAPGIEVFAPSRAELDITRFGTIPKILERYDPDVVVHAAAYTDVSGAETEREACWESNVGGTRNVVRALAGMKAKLVYISTDYVFWGDTGGYAEEDAPGPVRNYYALSKLVAEEVAQVRPGTLVIRTSFRPREWPYPVAFDDVYTSQDYVDIIAPEIALAVRHASSVPHPMLHIATERKSVYELARRRSQSVQPGSRRDSRVSLPEDISLDTRLWRTLKERLSKGRPPASASIG
ncbi:MAG: NAD(P)-dependent oxidoreductase [Actinobacteria bacterium]|nr:NAD(P)-dependent oxidoreductase [Actinomycetota bacterium]